MSSEESRSHTQSGLAFHETAAHPTFDETDILGIRASTSDTFLPTWCDRPSTNLGEPSHDKIEGRQLFRTLYCNTSTLSARVLVSRGQATRTAHSCDLVECTNIVCSLTSSDLGNRMFGAHYLSYVKSNASLSQACRTVPNHHYACHIPEQLRCWGPLMHLSEFAFERQNGLLQRFNSNNHLSK